MKNLKDYLDTKTAIACRTTEQAKFVNDFLSNNGGRSLFTHWLDRFNKSKNYHNCIEFSLNNLPTNTYCHEGYYKEAGYNILEASEFMPSLVGRKIKALIDKPNGGLIEKDEIGEIVRVDKYGLPHKVNFPSQSSYIVVYDERKYELLPIDYQESSDELKVGDWVVVIGDSSILKKGDITTITFYGEHAGITKVMTPELDKAFPSKTGWRYSEDFRKATAEEIQSVISKQPIETFKLPEKWCVKRTSDNYVIINNYFNNNSQSRFSDNNSWVTNDHLDRWINTSRNQPEGYTEITFEQFKQYVLKENPIYEKPLTPEECFNPNDPTDIVIPKLTKPVIKPDFIINNTLMEINIPLKVKSVKQVKPITINKFSLTI